MTVQPPRQIPQVRPAERYDRTYWLNRCQGFEVAARGCRLGVVSEIRYASRADTPDLIVVRTGHLRPDLQLIPIDQVETIDADSGSIELNAEATAIKKQHHHRWSRRNPMKRITPSHAS